MPWLGGSRNWCESVASERNREREEKTVVLSAFALSVLLCDIASGMGSVDVDDVARSKAAAT